MCICTLNYFGFNQVLNSGIFSFWENCYNKMVRCLAECVSMATTLSLAGYWRSVAEEEKWTPLSSCWSGASRMAEIHTLIKTCAWKHKNTHGIRTSIRTCVSAGRTGWRQTMRKWQWILGLFQWFCLFSPLLSLALVDLIWLITENGSLETSSYDLPIMEWLLIC